MKIRRAFEYDNFDGLLGYRPTGTSRIAIAAANEDKMTSLINK